VPAINLSEQELVKQLQNERSRDKAFRVLVLQYQERLYWHIRKIKEIQNYILGYTESQQMSR